MNRTKRLLRALLPFGVVDYRQRRINRQEKEKALTNFAELQKERLERITKVNALMFEGNRFFGDDYEQVIRFLRDKGIPEFHLREGSIPLASLEFLRKEVFLRLDNKTPALALHIGNFVGVSLAFLAASLVQQNSDSLIVSVDPNLPHRGIENPQEYVSALLTACGLQRNVMIIAGYSGEKSISNDGTVFNNYDPLIEFNTETACEFALPNLNKLCFKCFDLVIIDGNHEGKYLLKEIERVVPLLKSGGYLILDDVTQNWNEILDIFIRIESFGLLSQGSDGRVGIARVL